MIRAIANEVPERLSLPRAALELLTEAEVAAALRVTDRTVRRWDAEGIVHAIRIGGVKRYRASDIAALIDPQRSEAPAGNQGFAKADAVPSDDER